jgi:hypothetical protein
VDRPCAGGAERGSSRCILRGGSAGAGCACQARRDRAADHRRPYHRSGPAVRRASRPAGQKHFSTHCTTAGSPARSTAISAHPRRSRTTPRGTSAGWHLRSGPALQKRGTWLAPSCASRAAAGGNPGPVRGTQRHRRHLRRAAQHRRCPAGVRPGRPDRVHPAHPPARAGGRRCRCTPSSAARRGQHLAYVDHRHLPCVQQPRRPALGRRRAPGRLAADSYCQHRRLDHQLARPVRAVGMTTGLAMQQRSAQARTAATSHERALAECRLYAS